MALNRKELGNITTGLAFLAPNIVGVLVFTVFPVIFSIMLAFTNWDLRRHNMFKKEPLEFIGLDNFIRLFTEADFLRFMGNTLFLMMGIPFAVGGALLSAIMLSKNPGGKGKTRVWLLASALLVAAVAMLTVVGMGSTAMIVLMTGVVCTILIIGVGGGTTVYRTLFYAPHFTAGVATFLLWKKLFSPETGPINMALAPILDVVSHAVNALPASLVQAGLWLCIAVMLGLFYWTVRKLWQMYADGDIGGGAGIMALVILCIPAIVAQQWSYTHGTSGTVLVVVAAMILAGFGLVGFIRGRDFDSRAMEGFGTALILALAVMVGQFIFLGIGVVMNNLPAMASNGLEPPPWLQNYDWAKPSLMLMSFWAAIGSNNMLLYLAALSNVPEELYEASHIDGASRFQTFWHVTWPQLAPTTFFILVMSTIGGLQGGFEMARTMTNGGPAGATTTLSYFIYTEGFETGRLGFAAAVAWALFIMVFSVTVFNWTFGNKYVND